VLGDAQYLTGRSPEHPVLDGLALSGGWTVAPAEVPPASVTPWF